LKRASVGGVVNRFPSHPLYVQKGLNGPFTQGRTKMHKPNRILPWVLSAIAAPALVFASQATAQTHPVPQPQPVAAAPISDQELTAEQEKLIQLLRTSPTLTTVVAHDPSLLADQEYVNRNNPQLGQFLTQHPEIARNPEYYLFTNLDPHSGRRDQALQRAVWPEFSQQRRDPPRPSEVIGPIAGAAAFACFLGALVWLIRQFLENRRWSRIFKLQSDVHGRLIEKFSSNQELAGYMETEAGKRFLEAAPIPVGFEPDHRMPNVLARVLMPLQIGIVLVLLGCGLLFLRHVGSDMNSPMLVLGTVVLMPGLGFIISAGITWVLASRLGLMPEVPTAMASNRHEPPAGQQDA